MLQEIPASVLKKRKRNDHINSGGVTVTQASMDRSKGNRVDNPDLPSKGPMNIENYYSDKQNE